MLGLSLVTVFVRCFAIFLNDVFAQLMKHITIIVSIGVVYSNESIFCKSNYQVRVRDLILSAERRVTTFETFEAK